MRKRTGLANEFTNEHSEAFFNEAAPSAGTFRTAPRKCDATVAVDDVSLTINQGETFALLGGPGSGKTTLLRLLAGFARPREGRSVLDGEDSTDMAPYAQPIDRMFKSQALFPHRSVEQNIAFGLKQDKRPRAEINAIASLILLVVSLFTLLAWLMTRSSEIRRKKAIADAMQEAFHHAPRAAPAS